MKHIIFVLILFQMSALHAILSSNHGSYMKIKDALEFFDKDGASSNEIGKRVDINQSLMNEANKHNLVRELTMAVDSNTRKRKPNRTPLSLKAKNSVFNLKNKHIKKLNTLKQYI